jgi:plasmid stabilization system protein ParE
LRVHFSEQAATELEAAAIWYEEQQRGLGSEFIRSIDVSLSKISRSPLLYSIALDEMRRCLLKKFPFGIFFSIESDHILIVSIFHSRRNPQKLKKPSL